MKWVGILLLVTCSVLHSCTGYYHGTKLPVLTINGKPRNGHILHRIPDYGDGNRDGCLSMDEMRLDLDTRIQGTLSGTVSEAASKSKKPLTGVVIGILTMNGSKIEAISDSIGNFFIKTNDKISWVEANFVGYRAFVAKM